MLTSIGHEVSPRYAAGLGFSQPWIGTPSSISSMGFGVKNKTPGRCLEGLFALRKTRVLASGSMEAGLEVEAAHRAYGHEGDDPSKIAMTAGQSSSQASHPSALMGFGVTVRLHYGGSWRRALGSEVEAAHRAYDEGDDQQDCDDQGNPSQASHPALTIVRTLWRVGYGRTTSTVRLL